MESQAKKQTKKRGWESLFYIIVGKVENQYYGIFIQQYFGINVIKLEPWFVGYLSCWIRTFLSAYFVYEQFLNWFSREFTLLKYKIIILQFYHYTMTEDFIHVTHSVFGSENKKRGHLQ